jgi:hypothetical protein
MKITGISIILGVYRQAQLHCDSAVHTCIPSFISNNGMAVPCGVSEGKPAANVPYPLYDAAVANVALLFACLLPDSASLS